MSAAPAIRLEAVRHLHPGAGLPALAGIDLEIAEGEIVALIGPSGAGKSTLLALADGRLRGWQGRAEVLGHPLSPNHPPPRARRAETGFVFQEFALVDRLSARQNVLNGRLGRTPVLASLAGYFGAADLQAVEAALADTGIADLAERRADQLSGGQRQRVAVARALAQEPRLLLADEPVGSLDPAGAEAVLGLMAWLARARGATLVFASHQPELAARIADRVIGLRGGRLVLDAPKARAGADTMRAAYGDALAVPA